MAAARRANFGYNRRAAHSGDAMAIDRLSRRFAITGLGALPFLSQIAGGEPAAPDSTRLPAATDKSQHLTIAVQINGRGPFRFVVDTGADRTVLANTTAGVLGLVPTGAVMLAGIVRTVSAQTVTVDSISFGPVRREKLQLPILPRSQLQADGYLGLDMLDGYQVILDFHERALEITEPMPTLLSVYRDPSIIVLPARGTSGHLRASRCTIDRQNVSAFVDTGAESTMGNEALYRQLVEADQNYDSHDTMKLIGLTGGSVEAHLTTPKLAEIGKLSFINCTIAIADLKVFEIWGLKDKPALLIGMNWLRQFRRVSIDYGRQEIRFELAQSGVTANLPA